MAGYYFKPPLRCAVDCPPGTLEEDSFCNFCEMGQYQDEIGATSCKPCPPGHSWETLGAYSIDQCTCESRGLHFLLLFASCL